MNEQQKIAYIQSQTVAALICAMGMNAENQQRAVLDQSMAYTDKDFSDLIDQHGLGCNSVQRFLLEG